MAEEITEAMRLAAESQGRRKALSNIPWYDLSEEDLRWLQDRGYGNASMEGRLGDLTTDRWRKQQDETARLANDPEYQLKQFLSEYGLDSWNGKAQRVYRELYRSGRAKKWSPQEMRAYAEKAGLWSGPDQEYPTTVTNDSPAAVNPNAAGGAAYRYGAGYGRETATDVRPWGQDPRLVHQPIGFGDPEAYNQRRGQTPTGAGNDARLIYQPEGFGDRDRYPGPAERVMARPGVDPRGDPDYRGDLPVNRRQRPAFIGGRGW